MRYLLRRTVHAFFLLAGVSVLAFLFTTLAPGNYFDEMRMNPQISSETLAALRAQYQLEKPLPVRYLSWVNSTIHGEMGFSFAYDRPVAPLLFARSRNTLLLTITATLLAWGIALPLGIWSAERRGSFPDKLLSWATATLMVIPELALMLGLLVIAVMTNWFPAGGMESLDFEKLSLFQKSRDLLLHMALPVIALVLSVLPLLLRHVRSAVAEVLGAPYIQAARGHGIAKRTLLYRYALPAAANPLISLFGFTLGGLLSGSLLIEVVMSWPGLGPMLLEAILSRDIFVVIGGVLFSALFLIGGNFLADMLLYWVDPRIRIQGKA